MPNHAVVATDVVGEMQRRAHLRRLQHRGVRVDVVLAERPQHQPLTSIVGQPLVALAAGRDRPRTPPLREYAPLRCAHRGV